MIGVLLPILLTLHIAVCVLLIVVVLMQRPRSEGLGAAFGGGMTENIFGAQTSHVLAKFTTYLGIVFFVLTLLLAIVYAKASTAPSPIQKELQELSDPLKKAPATPATPAAPQTTTSDGTSDVPLTTPTATPASFPTPKSETSPSAISPESSPKKP